MDERGSQDSAAPAGFGTRVRAALAWRWGSQIVAQFITWGATIMVVRLLDPADYGLFAMSQVVITALAFLNGWGFASSLIQADTVGDREVGQVFALLLITNIGLAIAQLLLAPVAADYYNQPAVEWLLQVQAAIFLTTPFIALPTSLLSRRLDFRSQGIANLVSAIVGALTALVLALAGQGIWALVFAPMLTFATRAIIMTMRARAWVKPVFDFRGAGALIGFGGAMTLCQLFWIVQSQSDIFIAGRVFDPHNLGLYSEALFLTLIVTGRFLPPINEVAFPAYAELHKAGRSLAPYFERTVRSVLLVTAPIYIGLALTAPEAIEVLFGEKWLAMAPIVTGLAPIMPLMALQIIASPATVAMGSSREYVFSSAVGAVVFVSAFLWGAGAGPMGLVAGWWIAAAILFLVTLLLTLPRVGLGFGGYARACLPAVTAAAAMAGVLWLLRGSVADLSAIVRLGILVAVGATIYTGVIALFWRHLVSDSLGFFKRRGAQPA